MVTVAACQFSPVRSAVEENLAVAMQMVYDAASGGAEIVVLPELCTSGYALRDVSEAAACSQTSDGPQTSAFAELARDVGCHIVFGYVELADGLLYNSAACVGPSGTLIGNARKRNLYGRDFLWASPGESPLPIVTSLSLGRLGILIGRDVANRYRTSNPLFKGGAPFYKKGSVDLVAVPCAWQEGGVYPPTEWMTLVEELGAAAVVSSRTGREVESRFLGGSCVIGRDMSVSRDGSSFRDDAVVGGTV